MPSRKGCCNVLGCLYKMAYSQQTQITREEEEETITSSGVSENNNNSEAESDGWLIVNPRAVQGVGYGTFLHDHTWGSNFVVRGHTHGCSEFCSKCFPMNSSVYENSDQQIYNRHRRMRLYDTQDICYCDGYLEICSHHYRSLPDFGDSDSDSDSDDEEVPALIALPQRVQRRTSATYFKPSYAEVCQSCSICLSESTNFIKLSCSHVFHKTCFEKWLSVSDTCPVCRGQPQMFSLFHRSSDLVDKANIVVDNLQDRIEDFSQQFENCCSTIKKIFSGAQQASIGFDTIMRICSLSKYNDGLIDKANFMWNIIMIVKNVSVVSFPWLQDLYFKSMDTEAIPQGLLESLFASTVITSLMPYGFGKIMDFMVKHSRIKFLSDTGLDSIINYILSLPALCLRFLGEHTPFTRTCKNMAKGYEYLLSFLPGSLQNKMQQRAVALCVKFVKDNGIIRNSEFVEEFNSVYQFYKESEIIDYVDLGRIPEGFKMTLSTLKIINLALQAINKTSRVVPVWLYAAGPSGSGKSTLFKRITRSMEENYSTYLHQQKENQKDFYDGYQNETIMWEDDITTGVQLSKYLQLASNYATPLDCSAISMKGVKKFTSSFILTSSNYTIQELVEDSEHQKALLRRSFYLDFGDVTCNGLVYYVRKESKELKPIVKVFDYDPVTGLSSMVSSFDPNNCERWFEKFAFDQLDNNASISKQQDAGHYVISKRLIPQGYQEIMERISSGFCELYVQYSPTHILTMLDSVFPKCTKCSSISLHLTKTTCCGTELCTACIINLDEKQPCYCRKHFTKSSIEFLQKSLNDVVNMVKRTSITYTLGKIKEIVLSQEFVVAVSISVLASLASVAIISGFEMIKKHVVKEEEPVYVAPPNYGNVRRVKIDTNNPIYALHAQAVYPQRITEPFQTHFEKIRKNMLFIKIIYCSTQVEGIGVFVDGLTLMVPAHFLLKEKTDMYRVYGNDQEGGQLIAGREMKISFLNVEEDVALLTFSLTTPPMFKSISSVFNTSLCKSKELFLITPDQLLKVNYPSTSTLSLPYFNYGSETIFCNKGSYEYEYQADGLCGALLIDGDGIVLGMHVAYDPMKNKGIARPFRRGVKNILLKCKNDGIDRVLSPISAFVCDSDIYRNVPDKSVIVTSDLYGVFPITRAPAVLKGKNQDGDNILKKAVTKNIKPVYEINEKALKYSEYALARMLGSRINRTLTKNEIINGSPGLFPGFDKDSSAGIPYNRKNSEIFDYPNSTWIDEVQSNIDKMYSEFNKNEFNITTVIFGDTLKDELRDLEKVLKPRLFAAGPVHYAIELKRLFGSLVSRVQQNRMRNGIMVGINPLGKEWDAFARRMTRLGYRIIPGDFANWDGGMLASFQECAIRILSNLTEEPDYAKWLLAHLINTTRAVLSESIVTTHSIPSGHFLTSFFNSIINYMYTSYAFYILCGNNRSFEEVYDLMERSIFSAKYGDDLFTNVHESVADQFNSFTFSEVMKEIGVGFTAENKMPHTKPFYMISECTFLRRNFSFSNKLNRIVGPLNRDTMLSTLSYVTDSLRMEELVDQKVNNFQREAYLHHDYDELMKVLNERYFDEYGFLPPLLSEEELFELYQKDKVSLYSLQPQARFSPFKCLEPIQEEDTDVKAGIDLIIYDSSGVESRLLVKGTNGVSLEGKKIPGKWGIVKGSVKINENIEDAALREFFEECGIQFSHTDFIQMHHVEQVYIFQIRISLFKLLSLGMKFDRKEIADATTTTSPLSYKLNRASRSYFTQLGKKDESDSDKES